MLKTTILLIALLAASGAAGAEYDIEDFRAEVVALRLEMIDLSPEDERAARHLQGAIEALGPVLGIIDEKDMDLVSGMFRHLARAMKKMESAARREESELLTAFVADWSERLWLLTSVLLAPDNPAVTNPDADHLQVRLGKKLRKAWNSATRGRFRTAVKKLGPAWKIHVKIERVL